MLEHATIRSRNETQPATGPQSPSRHVPELDGLRGTAILLVMLLHFWPEEFALSQFPLVGPFLTKVALGGSWGVQLFFVLSGFLITGILMDSKGEPGYFRRFYARRVLRIFPLYFGTLFVAFNILPHLVAFDAGAMDMQRRQVWLWTFLSNTGFSGGPWEGSTVFWFVHFWSLCVEEHYYLVWPFVVWALPKRRLTPVCSGVILFSLVFRIARTLLSGPETPASGLLGFGTLSKLDGLATGSLIAIAFRSGVSTETILMWARRLWIPTLGFLILTVFWPRRMNGTLLAAVCETPICFLFTAALIRVILEEPRSWWRRIAGCRLLGLFGKYSYGLYVIHGVLRPVLQEALPVARFQAFLGFAPGALLLFYLTTVTLCLALAVVCYHLWETPFLRLKRHFTPGAFQATA